MIRVTYIIIFIFIGCACTPLNIEREFDLSNPFEYIMVHEGNSMAFDKAEFILEGYFNSSGRLLLFHEPYPEGRDNLGGGIIIEGNIELEFTQTWYSREVLAIFIPFEPGTGWLRIKFRVF